MAGSRGRSHTPSKSIEDINSLGGAFSLELAREIIAAVDLPATLDEDDTIPEITNNPSFGPDDQLAAQLARRLNDAAKQWGYEEAKQTGASHKMRAILAERVHREAEQLLSSLCGNDGKVVASLGPGGLWAQAALDGIESGKVAVAEILSGLKDLSRWSGDLAQREIAQARRENPSSIADVAFAKFLASLGSIYIRFWGRAPTVSTVEKPSQTEYTGPFFRMVDKVLYELDDSRSPAAIAQAIRRNEGLKRLRSLYQAL